MNKSTIFGEESFFDKCMVEIYEAENKYIYDKFSSAIKVAMPNVKINEERLVKWVNLCLKLDNIDKSDLIEMATQKKFADLQHRLDVAEKALELACDYLVSNDDKDDELYKLVKNIFNDEDKYLKTKINYFKEQAKSELKEENGYIIFSDGYDKNGNEIHKQEFVTYKDKCKELIEENKKLKQSQKQLAIENCELKKEKLYFDLLFTRLQYIHKQADEFREEKERYGIKDMALDSIWQVFDLQKHDCCEYEEMCELENGIASIANDKLLRDIEHDLQFKPTRTVDEIFEEIQKIDNQIKELGGGENECENRVVKH